jgi:GntR family transcriptional regulator, vanillate catabolism transcriptional regulator
VPRGDSLQTVRATLGLRQLLFDGTIRPGERLVELSLVERLGVSRTPLKLALTTLEHEGLLETLPGGGFAVRGFTRDDVADAIELRGVLEGTAARFAAERRTTADELAGLRAITMELDAVVHDDSADALVSYTALNEQFHTELVVLARSAVLARQISRVTSLPFAAPTALLASYAQLPGWRETLIVAQHQHHALVDAIAAGHGTRAEEVAREHARLSRQNLEHLLQRRELLEQLPGAPLVNVAG